MLRQARSALGSIPAHSQGPARDLFLQAQGCLDLSKSIVFLKLGLDDCLFIVELCTTNQSDRAIHDSLSACGAGRTILNNVGCRCGGYVRTDIIRQRGEGEYREYNQLHRIRASTMNTTRGAWMGGYEGNVGDTTTTMQDDDRYKTSREQAETTAEDTKQDACVGPAPAASGRRRRLTSCRSCRAGAGAACA